MVFEIPSVHQESYFETSTNQQFTFDPANVVDVATNADWPTNKSTSLFSQIICSNV